MLTDDGMFVFDNKVSVTFAVGATGPDVEAVFKDDADVDCVGGGCSGGAAVVAWVVSGGVFTAAETIGFCSTGGEDSGTAGGNAATVLGRGDMEAWL